MNVLRFVRRQIRTHPKITAMGIIVWFALTGIYAFMIYSWSEANNCRTLECDAYVAPGVAYIIANSILLTLLSFIMAGLIMIAIWMVKLPTR